MKTARRECAEHVAMTLWLRGDWMSAAELCRATGYTRIQVYAAAALLAHEGRLTKEGTNMRRRYRATGNNPNGLGNGRARARSSLNSTKAG